MPTKKKNVIPQQLKNDAYTRSIERRRNGVTLPEGTKKQSDGYWSNSPTKATKTAKRISYDGTGYDVSSAGAREEKANIRRPSNTRKKVSYDGTGYDVSSAGAREEKANTTMKAANQQNMMREARRKQQEARDVDEFRKQYEALTRQTVRGNAEQRYKATKKRQAYEEAFRQSHPGVDTEKLKRKKMIQTSGRR